MLDKKFKGMPFNYNDDKYDVQFIVADKELTLKLFKELDFIDKIIEIEDGFQLNIAIQQIPDIVICLAEKNIGIYAVIPL